MSTVATVGYRHTEDIQFDATRSASKWDRLATVCVTRAHEALKNPSRSYTKVHRDTMGDLLRAMLTTHGSIGMLLREARRAADTGYCHADL